MREIQKEIEESKIQKEKREREDERERQRERCSSLCDCVYVCACGVVPRRYRSCGGVVAASGEFVMHSPADDKGPVVGGGKY